MSFELVDSICGINKLDALLVLEAFDSDQRNKAGKKLRYIFDEP
jgi:hypothetical protein